MHRKHAVSWITSCASPVRYRLTPLGIAFLIGLFVLALSAPPEPAGVSSSLAASVPAGDAGYPLALPGNTYAFPRDHGSHDRFRTEWWYFTGHLFGRDGRRLGYELTFFRRALRPETPRQGGSRWAIHQLYLAHFAISDVAENRFLYTERLSRAALGKAGSASGRLRVWIDRWSAETTSPDHDTVSLRATGDGFAIDLRLTPLKPPVIHGLDGISRKGDGHGQASHYYSFTRLRTEGTVRLPSETLQVNGTSWMDHEFGSADLGEGQVGWDWFSVQLQDRTELMLYLLRRADGSPDPASSGTFIATDGHARHLTIDDLTITVLAHWNSAASGARYPSAWRVDVPSLGLSLTLSPLMAKQELITGRSTQVTYWEGAVTIEGTRHGESIHGHGYVELTGYAEPFDRRL